MSARAARDLRRRQELDLLRAQVLALTQERDSALLGEWSAKRGLADYMQEHGLGHRINPVVLAQIEAGPPQQTSAPNDG